MFMRAGSPIRVNKTQMKHMFVYDLHDNLTHDALEPESKQGALSVWPRPSQHLSGKSTAGTVWLIGPLVLQFKEFSHVMRRN